MTLSLVPRDDETIEGAGRALRDGRITCVGLVERCLSAIDEWEPTIRAWVEIDRCGAQAAGAALDAELAEGQDRGPLHGIPIGVKDVFDVKGFPTRAGALRWSTEPAEADSRPVAALREAGAIFLGKTITTPYAFIDPPPTRNPWNFDRTPGGSSSGSAVAVAMGMCLAALGTQTAGSLTRPASFCGICSWKPWSNPPLGRGMSALPLAPTLDTVGVMARTIGDLSIIDRELRLPLYEMGNTRLTHHDSQERTVIIRLREYCLESRVEPDMDRAMDRAVEVWQRAGIQVLELPPTPGFDEALKSARVIMAAEAANVHAKRFEEDRDDYPPRIAGLIDEGRSVRAVDYLAALDAREAISARLLEAVGKFGIASIDALLLPATSGAAPTPETTGDASFNAPWNFFDWPTLSFPIGLSEDGMPLAAQLVGNCGWFPAIAPRLCTAAIRCERSIRSTLEAERA